MPRPIWPTEKSLLLSIISYIYICMFIRDPLNGLWNNPHITGYNPLIYPKQPGGLLSLLIYGVCHNHLKQPLKKSEKPGTSPRDNDNTYLSIFFGPDVPQCFPGAYDVFPDLSIRFPCLAPQKKPRNAPSRSTHVPESWSLKQTSRGCRFPGEKTWTNEPTKTT